MRQLTLFIIIIAVIFGLAYFGYYWVWPALVSAFEWIIDFFKMVLSGLFYLLMTISLLGFLLLAWINRDSISESLEKNRHDAKLLSDAKEFDEFCSSRGGSVGRCGDSGVTWKAVGAYHPSILSLRAVLSLVGINRSENDISKRLESFGEKIKSPDPEVFYSCLSAYDVDCEIVDVGYGELIFSLWRGLKENKVAVLPVNSFRLDNPDDDVKRAGGKFDNLIIATGMRTSYVGSLLICYTYHKAKNRETKLIEARHLVRCASKKYVVSSRK